ncbi:AAA family ATPase [Actinoplanes sp. NPDC051411]|uniref:helix-turn-helix transcriptional regulator n=1 Tax=Actinoplanes sp. NPDC051411 TaxID=3155522 RepID=UPI003445C5EF
MNQRAALRGRSEEVAAALRALRAARDGDPSVLVVHGEPGIGKTALVHAVVEQAGRLGYAVGAATARDGDRLAPLSSLGPALRSGPRPLVGSDDFLSLAALNDQPLWLAERLAALLSARSDTEPLLVVVDDFQWSDPLSVFVLRLLTARLAGSRMCWLLAARNQAHRPADAVTEAVEGVLPVHRIDLAPLAGDAVLDIAADRLGHPADAGLAQRLATAGGNPFLVTQILEDGTPGGLVEAVRRRLAAASPECLALLRAGAVLGGRFRLGDAAQLGGEPPTAYADALAEAIALGMLTDDGRWLSFRHDLLRQAVYDGIPPSARWSMHRSFADHCVATGRGAAEAAPHILATAAEGDHEAADVLRTAALDLLATMSITSVTFIRQADALVADDRSRSPEFGRDVVRVLTVAHQHAQARDFADEILRDRPASADQAALVQLLLAPRLWAAGNRSELGRRAADPKTAGAAPALRARLTAYVALAVTDGAAGRTGEGEPADAVAAEVGRDGESAEAVGAAPGRTGEGERADAVGAEAGWAGQSEAADAVAAALAAVGRAETALSGGRYAEAAAHFRRAREIGGTASDETGAPDLAQLEIREIAATARFDLDAAFAALASARHADSWHAIEYAWLRADLQLGAGRLNEARQDAEQALHLAADFADHAFVGRVRAILAFVALARGSLGEARKQMAEAARAGTELPVLTGLIDDQEGAPAALQSPRAAEMPWWDEVLARHAVIAHRRGNLERLAEVAERLDRLAARHPGAAGPAGAAALAHGLLSGHPQRAVDLLTAGGRDLLLALAEEEAGRAGLVTADGRAEAVGSLERALARYEELGADAGAASVLHTLHQVGLRRRRRPPAHPRQETGWAALTTMERKVARLIAEGHSNRSAAAELTLSPNTVATHLRATYAKLGVNSRIRLAAAVNQVGVTSAD